MMLVLPTPAAPITTSLYCARDEGLEGRDRVMLSSSNCGNPLLLAIIIRAAITQSADAVTERHRIGDLMRRNSRSYGNIH